MNSASTRADTLFFFLVSPTILCNECSIGLFLFILVEIFNFKEINTNYFFVT